MLQRLSRNGPMALAALVTVLAHPQLAAADAKKPPQSYSAEQTVSVGGKIRVSTLNVAPDAVRVEDKQSGVVTILRRDKKIVWALLPAQRRYLELPLDTFSNLLPQGKPTNGRRDALGPEVLAGYHCVTARVHTTVNGVEHITVEWAAAELGGMVIKRTDGTGRWSVTYSAVRPGPQSAELFTLPAGYVRTEMPAMHH